MRALAAVCFAAVSVTACAPHRVALPSGDGTPRTDFAEIFNQATTSCRDITSLTATVALSGKAGGGRVRGQVLLGLAQDAIRLEGVAPFGAPVFILAGRDGKATLLLPRAHRVVAGASGSEILNALVGLDFTPDDLLAALSGCVVPHAAPQAGHGYGNDVVAIDLQGGARAFVTRQAGWWVLTSGLAKGVQIDYGAREGGWPMRVNLHGPDVDLSVRTDSYTLNANINPAAFVVDVPADAAPMTLDELTRRGPLGQ